jgi:laminin alpha 3/5
VAHVITYCFAVQVSEHFYVGGYPGQLPFRPVTDAGFDGCIDGVQIDGTPVDLSQNVEAFGVTPGCPAQVSARKMAELNSIEF